MENKRLTEILTRFANSGWDLIDTPAKNWLDNTTDIEAKKKLTDAIKQAKDECGSCGCEMDPLYTEALELLASKLPWFK